MLVPGEFRLEVGKIGAAGSRAGGIACLRHEIRNHAMKNNAIVESLRSKLLDALDMAGCKVRTKRDRDRSGLQLHHKRVCNLFRHHFPFSSLQRLTRRSATYGLVKGLTSPPSIAISLTSRELMAWLRGSA